MVALYLISTEPAAGKTALAASLGRKLQDKGQRVGYFKPLIGTQPRPDRDALFMKQVLALTEEENILSPVIGDFSDVTSIKEAYARVARGKDVVIVEGVAALGKSDGVAVALEAKVIMVVGYATVLPIADLVASGQRLGKHLLGIVVNKVPQNRTDSAYEQVATPLGAVGIKLLGILPEDRTLAAVTVGELAACLGGEMQNNADKSGELVENFMLGALGVDSGLTYFNRKQNKAVIARASRPDIQLAALETPTQCLVVTGGKAPAAVVVRRAQEKQVPIIFTKEDVAATMVKVEAALSQSRFNQGKKLPRLAEIMATRFDFKIVEQELGLAN